MAADLRGAVIVQADLSGAELDKAVLDGTILLDVDFSGASLIGMEFGTVGLNGLCRFKPTVIPSQEPNKTAVKKDPSQVRQPSHDHISSAQSLFVESNRPQKVGDTVFGVSAAWPRWNVEAATELVPLEGFQLFPLK